MLPSRRIITLLLVLVASIGFLASGGRAQDIVQNPTLTGELKTLASDVTSGDAGRLETARKRLRELADKSPRAGEEDLGPAVLTLLGDSYLLQEQPDPEEAWVQYNRALDYWARDRRLNLAAEQYGAVIEHAASIAGERMGIHVPVWALENLLDISQNEKHLVLAHYFLGRHLAAESAATQNARAGSEYALALADATGTRWHDDILFHYANWAAINGYNTYDDQGQILLEPDFERALELHAQLLSDPALADSPHLDAARSAVEQISASSLNVAVAHVFRPNTQIQFLVNWRNLQQVEIALHPIDLLEVNLSAADDVNDWLQTLSPKSEPVRRLTLTQQPARPHYEVSHLVRIDEALPYGAYLVNVKSGNRTARDVVIVSDHALVLKVTDTQALAYMGSANNGAPAAEAPIALWIKAGGSWKPYKRTAGADGIVMTTLPEGGIEEVAAFSSVGGSQAFAILSSKPAKGGKGQIQIYPYTSRQNYKPGDTVRWAMIARISSEMQWIPPQVREITWRIIGPTGSEILQETTPLNAYGAASGTFNLPNRLPLGLYSVELAEGEKPPRHPLFVVQEAFSSDIALIVNLPPGQLGGGYSTGESIRGTVAANYVFGGPVANAEVQLTIREQVFDASIEGLDGQPTSAGRELVRQTLRTDTRGQASFTLQTSPSTNSDFIYSLEFRTKDSNGRPAVESITIRATRQAAYAYVRSQMQLYLPNQPVKINVQYLNDLGHPMPQQGQLRILRESWREVWVDRRGREISGEELRQLKKSSGGWFSFGPSPSDYRLKSEGYQTEEVFSTTVECNERGFGEFSWQKAQPGFYRVLWVADSPGGVVRGEDSFWVCGPESADIGYRAERIQLVSNNIQYNAADTAPVMIVTPSPERYVLITTGTEKIDSWMLIHLAETARLTNVSLGKHHAPALAIQATAISETRITVSEAQVRVKAVEHALQIGATGSNGNYKPGEEVTLQVTVRNALGEPVPRALVMLSVTGRSTSERMQQPPIDAFFAGSFQTRTETASGIQEKPFFRPLDPNLNSIGNLASAESPTTTAGARLLPEPLLAAKTLETRTAAWQPHLLTDATGTVQVSFALPRQSSDYVCIIRAMDDAGAMAEHQFSLTTRQPISSSYTLPRHAYPGDTIGNLLTLTNETSEPMVARVSTAERTANEHEVTLGPHGTSDRVWKSVGQNPGEISYEVSVSYGDTTDNIVESVSVQPKRRHRYGGAEAGPSPRFNIVLPNLPKGLVPEVTISATPSLAAIALEELIALLDLPHSSTGETVSRFAGPALLLNTLHQLSFDDEAIRTGAGRDIPAETEFATDHGIAILAYYQQESGAWGWFNGGAEDPFLSAYILTLLYLTTSDGIEVPPLLLERGQLYLAQRLIDDEDSNDVQAWILQALAHRFLLEPGRPTRLEARAMINLIREQERLGGFGLASLAMAAHLYGLEDESRALLNALIKRADTADAGGTGHRYWMGSGSNGGSAVSAIETTALALGAKSRITELDETDRGTLHWLISAAMDKEPLLSYRERTVFALALRAFLQRTGDFDAVGDAEIWANETYIGTSRVNVSNPLTTTWKWKLPHTILKPQQNKIEIRRIRGESPWIGIATVQLPPEARVEDTSKGMSLTRQFIRTKLAPTLLNGYVEESDIIEDEGRINPGDRIEVVLRITTTEPVRHLVVEDYRPGCLELSRGGVGLEIRATEESDAARSVPVITESAEDSTTFFIEQLPAGSWELRYPLRARALGNYLAPPAMAFPMEKPAVRASSEPVVLRCWSE